MAADKFRKQPALKIAIISGLFWVLQHQGRGEEEYEKTMGQQDDSDDGADHSDSGAHPLIAMVVYRHALAN